MLHRRLDRRILHRRAGQLGRARRAAPRPARCRCGLAGCPPARASAARRSAPPAPRSATDDRAATDSRSGSRAAPRASTPCSSSARTVHFAEMVGERRPLARARRRGTPPSSAPPARRAAAAATGGARGRSPRRGAGGARARRGGDGRGAAPGRRAAAAAPASPPRSARLEVGETLQQLVHRQQRRQAPPSLSSAISSTSFGYGARATSSSVSSRMRKARSQSSAGMRCACARSAVASSSATSGSSAPPLTLRDREVAEVLEQVAGEAAQVAAVLVGVVERRRGRAPDRAR